MTKYLYLEFALINFYFFIFYTMALQKAISTQYGVDANYWKNSRISFDLQTQSAQSTCLGYASEEAAKNKAVAMESDTVNVCFFWTQEELENAKPKKTDALIELEAIQDKTDEQEAQMESMQIQYAQQLDMWEKMTNPLIINEELATAFGIISKYAYEMHKK